MFYTLLTIFKLQVVKQIHVLELWANKINNFLKDYKFPFKLTLVSSLYYAGLTSFFPGLLSNPVYSSWCHVFTQDTFP